MSMRYLSKSKYTAFRQCPKNLWLRTYKPEEVVIDAALQARFEAAFSWDGNYCDVDILHKQDGGYAIYEVKSSTNSSLAPSDSDYIRGKDLDIQRLFVKTDMSNLINVEYPSVQANVDKAKI